MTAPAWFEDWRHDAVHELIRKNAALSDRFGLKALPRYDYELDQRRLTFFGERGPEVVAEIHIVGTTGLKDWLWGWANPHWAPELTLDLEKVRAFGEANGIDDLVTERLEDDDLNGLGWECAAIAARILDAPGVYRPRSTDGRGLFFVYRSIDRVL